ncbi:MAG: electron transfer flavoprotein subunit alpha/FixB family protein [Betaproteobacteria bacterium]|nr:MAG: electron transfer flavoprotein subunit alpha/FixB family protein [Betaproteobacteria bacterium]
MTILVLAEHDNSSLKSATSHAVTAAQKLGDDITVLVVGYDAASVAHAAAQFAGVRRIVHVDAPHLQKPTAENVAAELLAVIRAGKYTHVLAPSTAFGKNVLPRVAAVLDVAQISDITAIEAPDTFIRPIYAGNAFATIQSKDAIKVITVRTTAFESAGGEGAASIETTPAQAEIATAKVVGEELTTSERPELTSARIVISGGRGLGSGDNFKLLEALADKLNAAIGASRAAVDAGYVPNDYQVGQTGKIVAPDLYIAIGISGAIQHLAGMKDSKVIVAINKDPEAPIFQIADYGLVGDLFDVIPQLTAKLSSP